MWAEYKPADFRSGGSDISGLIFFANRSAKVLRMDTIGNRVRALRKSRGYTQVQLAKKLGVTQPALSLIESGDTTSLSGAVLAGLCETLVSTPDYIMWGADDGDGHEQAMQRAELVAIASKLPPQSLEALLDSARLLARATSVNIPGSGLSAAPRKGRSLVGGGLDVIKPEDASKAQSKTTRKVG